MNSKLLIVTLALAVLRPGWCAADSSKEQACNRVVRALTKSLAATGNTHGYQCSLHRESASYFVFRLTANIPMQDGGDKNWVGSNLMGYFAVNRKNGRVYYWDIAEERLGLALTPET